MHAIFEGGAAFTKTPDSTRIEAVRLSIGRMMRHIADTIERPDGKLHLYSGHDWTVSPLLLCVAHHDDPAFHSWPPFCSNIAFEVWSSRPSDDDGLNHYACDGAGHGRHVRVLYNGVPVALRCGTAGEEACTVCSVAQFRAMVDDYCITDFAAECGQSPPARAAGIDGKKPAFNR